MNRIDRLTGILIHLQGKSRVPIGELQERFEIGRRTIFRDIKSLIEAGVPIGGEAGEGYFIVEGYHLPPVVFNKEEAAALLLGSKLINQNTDEETNKKVEEAMLKVRAVLKYQDRNFLETLENSIEIIGSRAVMKKNFPNSFLSEIQLALVARNSVKISYHSNYNDSNTTRIVNPLGLVYYSNKWHMIGHCQLRNGMRDFRTDRIQKLTLTKEHFNPEDYPDYIHFTSGMLGGTDAKEAVIQFSKSVVRYIDDQKYYYGFLDQKEVGEAVEMKFVTPQYEFLARWILMFVDQATIIAPAELQGLVSKYARKSAEHHQKYFE